MSSESTVRVVRVEAIEKHPNADALGIVMVDGGYPVCVRLTDFKPGDLAVYVPIDSVVPEQERWAFLGNHRRIRAKKLRGVFSMGLLTAADASHAEGDDVGEALAITKWEPPPKGFQGPGYVRNYEDDADAPGCLAPTYTDVEGLRRYSRALIEGEAVVVTEKIHGENFRAVYWDGALHVGSRTRWKRRGAGGWWRAAWSAALEEKLEAHPGVVLYGESHGYTGGFPYATKPGTASLRVFDALRDGRYMDAPAFAGFAASIGVETAPVLHAGPWSDELRALAEGPSTIDASHVREGFVVRPITERFDRGLGRVILKLHGEGFLLK